MEDIYKSWESAELSMMKRDGKITEFTRELILQPLKVHEIHKKGLEDKTIFVNSLQRFNRLFNTAVKFQKLKIKRRKIMRAVEEEGYVSLNAYCKSTGDSQFANMNGYILLFTQGAKNEK
jgi:hypothetical protein